MIKIIVVITTIVIPNKFQTNYFRVGKFNEKNKMTIHNLGVCFGPVIFRSSSGNSSFSKGIEEAQNQQELVSFLITNKTALFG